MKVSKIAIIGGGKMGEAILAGLIASNKNPAAAFVANSFIVANPGLARREYLEAKYGVKCVASALEIEDASLVILSIKPQVMPSVLEEIREHTESWNAPLGPLYVSIAAGITSLSLTKMLNPGARVVRTMPNVPLMVGEGMTAVVANGGASSDDVFFVSDLFACLGRACVVDEACMDAVCAISGSGPAYVAYMVEALRDAGVEQGLDENLAQELALQTVFGTAKLLSTSAESPQQIRQSVCSPGGTTLAAIDAMDAIGFKELFSAGVAAATKRSKELGA
jgi:pyrroline-5-carboxylate reductase